MLSWWRFSTVADHKEYSIYQPALEEKHRIKITRTQQLGFQFWWAQINDNWLITSRRSQSVLTGREAFLTFKSTISCPLNQSHRKYKHYFLFIQFYLYFLCNFVLLHFFNLFRTDKPLDIAQNWSGVTPAAHWYSTHESKTQPQPSELGRFIRFCSSWDRVLSSSSVHTSLANCLTSSTALKYMINASAVETSQTYCYLLHKLPREAL